MKLVIGNDRECVLAVLEGDAPREPGWSANATAVLVIAAIGILILMLVVLELLRRVKKEKDLRKELEKKRKDLFVYGNTEQLNPDCPIDEQAELLPYNEDWEIHRDDISLGTVF